MFRLEMDRPAGCSSRSRRSLIRRNKQGSLSRVPEELAMDNSAAYTEYAAGPAVFTCPSVIRTSPDRSVSLWTLSRSSGQSADWFVSSRTLAKTARPCSFYIYLCFYFCLYFYVYFYFYLCLRFYFVFAVVSAFGFACLLFSFFTFSFFNHFIFYSFSLIFFLLPILCTMTTILSVVNKICKWRCFPLNQRHYRHFFNTDWSPTAGRHFVPISQTKYRSNRRTAARKKLQQTRPAR